MTARESALVIVLEDAEPFDEVRREFAAKTVASGIPFHVTLLYPFAPENELTDEVLQTARSFFASRRPFAFELTRIAMWPDVVYALPEPDAELRDCMRALHALYPQWPPYGGIYEQLNPHATLAEATDAAKVYPEIERRLTAVLPVQYSVDAVALLEEHEPEKWRERERMALGG